MFMFNILYNLIYLQHEIFDVYVKILLLTSNFTSHHATKPSVVIN